MMKIIILFLNAVLFDKYSSVNSSKSVVHRFINFIIDVTIRKSKIEG